VIFVTDRRVGTINSRSLTLTSSLPAPNHTHIISAGHTDNLPDNAVLVLLNTGELARFLNDRLTVVQILPQIKGELSQSSGSVYMQLLGNHLFVVYKQHAVVNVFTIVNNKYLHTLTITFPLPDSTDPHYHFYNVNDSVRLVLSTKEETRIYELLLPTQ
jgi:hypothetical protein